ncbi:hypothetical protein QZH41_007174 [Actinostola sp. cb2023]|nr:hypothetical protein QZH41_007174 [Actinostola sp. cb2023]
MGEVEAPHLVLPLTIEPSKPRLCHDARFLNLWMTDMPFKLDNLTHIPRYVGKNTYQTVLDDKSGYDHLLLTEESRPFFGIQWGGWYFVYNTLPFGWKISPFVYHSTGLMASNFFRSSGIPCSLYIDDRHNGQLQVDLTQGAYVAMTSEDDRNLAAGKSAIFVVAYHLIKLGYFLGIAKSILNPSKTVPYLGFISDSGHQVFHLIPEKKEKFIKLVREVLTHSVVSVKTLQRLVGKCVSLSLAVPGALLFTREMNNAISKGLRTHKQVKIDKMLREEISHWLFLESWDDPLPWRDERHIQVSLASDASGYGWGGWMIVDGTPEVTSDYWTEEEYHNDISTKEALALNKTLLSFGDTLRNVWVDALVDNMAVVHTWQRQGGRSIALNRAMKELFFTTVKLNISLHITHISSEKNPADGPSRRLSLIDCKLHPTVWHEVQQQFGGETGHTCDLMALDSNTMTDRNGEPLPHFTPTCSPGSSGVNVFAQNVANEVGYLRHPYVFPPLGLVGPILRFLETQKRSCTFVVLDVYPKRFWWPLLQRYSVRSARLARKGDKNALLVPSRQGWVPHWGIAVDSYIGKLRAIFHAHGRDGEWDKRFGLGNPAADKSVKDYLRMITSEQLQARIQPKQATPFFIDKLVQLTTHIEAGLQSSSLSPTQRFILARDQAYFKAVFFSGDRPGDMGQVKVPEMLRFPNNDGLLFNHVLGENLKGGCLAMNTDEGYARARELLKSRYGQPFKIATTYIENVLRTPLTKAEDARALQRYSVLLASCVDTLTKIGYASKIDNPDTLRKIIEKLPFSLRDRWRATADDINELDEKTLPKKEEFFSRLNDSDISEDDYKHAQKVWQVFKMKTMRDYHDLYLLSDVLLLMDVFETFRVVGIAAGIGYVGKKTMKESFINDPSTSLSNYGAHNRSKNEMSTQKFGIDKMVVHRRFLTDKEYGYDIALIKLSRPAVLNYAVGLASLPKQGDRVPVGTKCYFTGDACSDNHYYCSVWKEQDRCKDGYFEHSLKNYCPLSCGYCTLSVKEKCLKSLTKSISQDLTE